MSMKLKNFNPSVRINENQYGNKQNLYFQKTNDGKNILRDVMNEIMPDHIIKGQKKGFSSPDASWFKGDSIDFVKSKLLNPKAKIYNVLDYKSTAKLIDEHLDGKQNRRLLIWSLLNVDEWIYQTL